MANRFANLRHNGTSRFGRREFYAISNYDTTEVARVKENYIEVYTGRVYGVWVAGYKYSIAGNGGCQLPCLSWGWFYSWREAMLYIMGEVLDNGKPIGALRRQLLEQINTTRQLNLAI